MGNCNSICYIWAYDLLENRRLIIVADRIKNLVRNINYLTKHSLWDQREEDIVYLTEKILNDGIYEYGISDIEEIIPHILTKEESLDEILRIKQSFVRTGDGECKIMMGIDQPFQKYEKEIDERLRQMLSIPREGLMVGINKSYYLSLNGKFANYYRRFAYDFRKVYSQFLNPYMVYIDAGFIGYDSRLCGRNPETDLHYQKWCDLFADKDIAVVCGGGILDKLQYDVFYKAKSKKLITGPRINAWDEHEIIIDKIVETVSRDTILVFILGMAGKAMIPELMDYGYTCWDVGHLAKYYNAYMSEMVWSNEARVKFYAPD